MDLAINQTTPGKWRGPFFLLEPLGWLQDHFGKALQGDPSLLGPLLELDQPRMHLIALAVAHSGCDITPGQMSVFLQSSEKEILAPSLGRPPVGLHRALRHLPPKVMAVETYRHLINLLGHPATAKFLQHSPMIKELTITGLATLPPALCRPAILALFNRVEGMHTFVQGLEFLSARAGLSFELVARDTGCLDQPEQVIAKVRRLIDCLPLPQHLPSAEIGQFKRIDSVSEIRALAKNWQNCLADHIYAVNEGSCAIYLSTALKTVCFLTRNGRLGWFLLQAKGPGNVPLDPDRHALVVRSFATAGNPDASIVDAIKAIHYWSPERLTED